jgi:hypothetical protein
MLLNNYQRFYLCFVLFLACAVLISTAGCGGGKKKKVVKNYGKPQWHQIDQSKFVKLSEDETTPPKGNNKIVLYDPVGWERLGPEGKVPKGFTSVIRFQKGEAMIVMTKSKNAADMDDLDKDNIEGFADSAQQLFKTKVEMVELGNIVGVMFRKAGKATQSVSGKKFERLVIATSIGGELFTYELIGDVAKIPVLRYTLFSLIAKTKIKGASNDTENDIETAKAETKEAEIKKAEDKPAESKPVEVAAIEKPAEKKAEDKPAESKPVEVAAIEKPAEKKAEDKPAEAKPEKKKKKGNTQNILNELDALLNN